MTDQVNPNAVLGIVTSLAATGIVFVQFLVKRGNIDVEKERWLLELNKSNQKELTDLRTRINEVNADAIKMRDMLLEATKTLNVERAEREQDKAKTEILSKRLAQMEIDFSAAQKEIARLKGEQDKGV